MTEPRLDVLELVRRIHIGQQAFATIHCDVLGSHHAHVQVFEELQHFQSAFRQPPDDRRVAGSSVDRAQWMISAFGPRHDNINGIAARKQAGQEVGRDKRHVTSDQNDTVVARGRERRVQTTEGTAVRHKISDTPKSPEIVGWTAADHHDIVRELTELIKLPIENPAPANRQRTFIAAAEAPCLSAGENRGACHL